MIEGVPNLVTSEGATPLGEVPITLASTNLSDKTAAGVAMFTAADAPAQLALIGAAASYIRVLEDTNEDTVLALGNHASYIRRTFATANTITIPKQSVVTWVPGTYFTVKNVGAGTLTITPVDGDVTIVGTAAVLQTASVKVVRIASNTWEVLPLS
jgi:archaellum component FlaG (FlaF/FlaG flagellin family)